MEGNTMTKKLISALLVVSVMLTAMVCVFAAAETTNENPTQTTIEVVFDANGGEGTMDPIAVKDGDVITVPECTMTKANFEFQGWNTNVDGSGTDYQPGAQLTTDVTITLFAQWAKAGYVEYIITYKPNGAEGDDMIDDYGYTPGMSAMAAFNEFTRDGYTFKEWNTKADGTGTGYAEMDEIIVDADLVLYAIWTGGSQDPVTPPTQDEQPPVDNEIVDVVESETEIPETGDATSTAIALATGVVALGALVVLKKKH